MNLLLYAHRIYKSKSRREHEITTTTFIWESFTTIAIIIYERVNKQTSEIYIYIIWMLVSVYNIILIDILIKIDLKATYYALFIIKGNHIAWDFEG